MAKKQENEIKSFKKSLISKSRLGGLRANCPNCEKLIRFGKNSSGFRCGNCFKKIQVADEFIELTDKLPAKTPYEKKQIIIIYSLLLLIIIMFIFLT